MTPVYDLNQPSSSFQLVEDQHLQLFLSPHHHDAPPTFFNTNDQDETKLIGESSLHHDHKVDKYISRSDHIPLSSSSSLQAAVNGDFDVHKCKRDQEDDYYYYYYYYEDGSEKWMPSKTRIMQKMINSKSNNTPLKFTLKFQDHQANSNSIRVCSDCNTTTTPLWRSGPRGPKSLCNACGIRQRKARRAMGNGTMDQTSSTKANNNNNKVKEKKSRTPPQCKKLCKPPLYHNHTQNTNITFKNLAFNLTNNSTLQPVFPQDVEEAAILLMELSCGFLHA